MLYEQWLLFSSEMRRQTSFRSLASILFIKSELPCRALCAPGVNLKFFMRLMRQVIEKSYPARSGYNENIKITSLDNLFQRHRIISFCVIRNSKIVGNYPTQKSKERKPASWPAREKLKNVIFHTFCLMKKLSKILNFQSLRWLCLYSNIPRKNFSDRFLNLPRGMTCSQNVFFLCRFFNLLQT